MSEVMTPPETTVPAVQVERRCQIEDVFDRSFIDLMTLAPRNPHIRALILKLIGRMPGPECETFEQVKHWVETSCQRKARPAGAGRTATDVGITITVGFAEMEYGSARYSVRRRGQDQFQLSADDLIDMVRDRLPEGIEGIVEAVAADIDDNAWSHCEPAMEDDGDYNYSDHDCSYTDDSETSYNREEIREAVLAFLRSRHPELLEELL
jgi:hypothetical protein